MIIDLPDTTVSQVAKQLVKVREEGGAVALGRVLTLVIAARNGVAEAAIDAANDASREHPMRVIVITTGEGESRLDAQIRVGGDAGASEVVVLRAFGDAASNEESLITGLLLPDAPVVAWWPESAPVAPAQSPLGKIAQRRITDAATAHDVRDRLALLGETHAPGDTDLAWTRLTTGASSSRPCSTSRRTSRSPGSRCAEPRHLRPPRCWPRGCRWLSMCRCSGRTKTPTSGLRASSRCA